MVLISIDLKKIKLQMSKLLVKKPDVLSLFVFIIYNGSE